MTPVTGVPEGFSLDASLVSLTWNFVPAGMTLPKAALAIVNEHANAKSFQARRRPKAVYRERKLL